MGTMAVFSEDFGFCLWPNQPAFLQREQFRLAGASLLAPVNCQPATIASLQNLFTANRQLALLLQFLYIFGQDYLLDIVTFFFDCIQLSFIAPVICHGFD